MPSKKQIYLILIALCFLVYANSLFNGFVSDDIPAILENPEVPGLSHYWLRPHGLLNSLSYHIAKFNTFPYHLINIIMHSIDTILVFLFLSLFFKAESSFLAASLFAVHPIHTEAVTWVSGRPYLFLVFFTLIVYFLYRRATNYDTAQKKLNIPLYLLALAIFSYYVRSNYQFFFLCPFFLILSDITFDKWKKNWLYWLPFLAVLAVVLTMEKGTILERISFVKQELEEPGLRNPIICFIRSFYSHLWPLIWPAKLTLYHEPITIPRLLFEYGTLLLIPPILLLILSFKRAKILFFTLGIFILFLAPTYSPIAIASVVADRYVYFPSIALSMLLAFLYDKYADKFFKFKKYIVAVLIFIIACCAVRTVARNEDWRSIERFWRKTTEISKNSARVHNNLGLVYLDEGNIKQAIVEFKQTVRLNPGHFRAYNNLGVVYNAIGDKQNAIAYLMKAIEINPNYSEAYRNLGRIYREWDDREKAIIFFNKSLGINPLQPLIYNDLGNIYASIGKAKEAIAAYSKAIQLDPKYTNAYYNLGNLYNTTGDKKEAVAFYEEALKIDPKLLDAYNNLGNVYHDLGDNQKAVSMFMKAIEINPDYLKAYNNLANLYLRIGENKEAIKVSKGALQINPYYAPALFNLSLAYFNEKDYAQAVEYCEKAIKTGYLVPDGYLKDLEPHRKK